MYDKLIGNQHNILRQTFNELWGYITFYTETKSNPSSVNQLHNETAVHK